MSDTREIFFRGLRLDNAKWIEGYYFKHLDTQCCFAEDFETNMKHHYILRDGLCDWNLEPPMECVEIDIKSRCQYTGRQDKNNKRIFENDIVIELDEQGNYNRLGFGVVVCKEYEFYIKWYFQGVYKYSDRLCAYESDKELVVYGNSFENPTLLKNQKESGELPPCIKIG